MILGLQIIAVMFSLIMIYFTYLNFRRGEINGTEVVVLLAVWFGAILITLFPTLFNTFSQAVAISRAFDLAVIGGFIFVIPLVYISYVRTRKLERKIEKLVRQESLNGVKNVKKSKKRPS